MEIKITIEDEDGTPLFFAHSKSVDSAIADLGKFERSFKAEVIEMSDF